MTGEKLPGDKLPTALKTIGEAAEALSLPQHVLRFWEEKFAEISPMKRRGRRYYGEEDMAFLEQIKHLLYDKGYTIKGVQKHLKEQMPARAHTQDADLTELSPPRVVRWQSLDVVQQVLEELRGTRHRLEQGLKDMA
jgi:DNA-binding transcriptional MerR regulator